MFGFNKTKDPERFPYYKIHEPFIGNPKWKCYWGSQGAMPLNIEAQPLKEKRVGGGSIYKAPPSPPKLPDYLAKECTSQKEYDSKLKEYLALQEYKKERAAKEEAAKKVAAEKKAKKEGAPPPPPPIAKDIPEPHPKPIDLLDIPNAMRKQGMKIAPLLMERWFKGSAYTIPDNTKTLDHPIEYELVTWDWVMKFGTVIHSMKGLKKRLLEEDIFTRPAQNELRKNVEKYLQSLMGTSILEVSSIFTPPVKTIEDFKNLHKDWQFQKASVDSLRTQNSIYPVPTDLTMAVGNCFMFAALGKANIQVVRYCVYLGKAPRPNPGAKAIGNMGVVSEGKMRWVKEITFKVTHVNLYLKDNFEFNPKQGEKKSQYLGHWNKEGFIISERAFISDLERAIYKTQVSHWGGGPIESKGQPYAVHVGSGNPKTYQDNLVYWPIYNQDFEEWRTIHKKGEDFIIVTKPKLFEVYVPFKNRGDFTFEFVIADEDIPMGRL